MKIFQTLAIVILAAACSASLQSQPHILVGNPGRSLVNSGIDTSDVDGLMKLIDSPDKTQSRDAALFLGQRGVVSAAAKIKARHARELEEPQPTWRYLAALFFMKDPETGRLTGEYMDLVHARRQTVDPGRRILDAAKIHVALKDTSKFGLIHLLCQNPATLRGEYNLTVLLGYSFEKVLVDRIFKTLCLYLDQKETPYRLSAVDQIGKLPHNAEVKRVLTNAAKNDPSEDVRALAEAYLKQWRE
jgi:hypothetical protein